MKKCSYCNSSDVTNHTLLTCNTCGIRELVPRASDTDTLDRAKISSLKIGIAHTIMVLEVAATIKAGIPHEAVIELLAILKK